MFEKKKPYLCAVEEMIQIRRSEYEQLLPQQKALEEVVCQLRTEVELLKNGRNSKLSYLSQAEDTRLWKNIFRADFYTHFM
jgi:hypothetical protein